MGAGQAGSMPARRDRQEIGPTHVDAVLEPYSDQGSIPCASMLARDASGASRFFVEQGEGAETMSLLLHKPLYTSMLGVH